MIYKFNNGGIVKLQNAGSVPEYGNIEQIAKYNREHGTNFWKMSQVLEHDKQQALQKSQNKKSFWEILAGHPESAGEAILNRAIETANNAELPETRSKIYNDTGKAQLATTAGSLLTLPMLGEFSTYSLLGGGLRLGTGIAGSKAGEYVLGKGGDWVDKKLNTKFLGTTGRIIGGLGGWWGGSSATTPLFRTLAGKGVTFHIPQETFMNLRGQYFDKAANKIKLDRSVLPTLQYRDRLMKDYLEFGPDTNIYGDNVSKLVHWDPMTTGTKSALPINGGFNRDPVYFPHFENGKLVPAIGQIRSNLGNGQMYEHPYHPIFFGGNKPWWETPGSNLSDQYLKQTTFNKSKFTGPKQYYDRWAKTERRNLRNLRNWYTKYGPQNKSDRYLITDPENLADYKFSYKLGIMGSEVPMSKLEGFEYDPLLGTFKRARYTDPSTTIVSPQEAATTYHFDGRMPFSKSISEAEKLGIPKSMRSNPKALEDPYYWGYKQWNSRYNAAVNSGNLKEAQRLRDLHFKIKSPNSPQYNFYHGTFNKDKPFYIFEPQSNNELFFHFSPYKDTAEKFMGIAKTRNENGRLITAKLNIQHPTMVTDSGWWNWYRIPEANPRISKTLGMDGPTAGQYYSDLLLKEPSVSEANGKIMDMLGNDAFMYKNYTEDIGRISVAIPRPSQIKLADPITRTNTGEIIPIVKRDNFHNPDIRYKQGGILKAQRGLKPFESATAKSYFSGLKDYLLHQTKSFTPSLYKPTKGSNIQQQYYTRPGLKEEVVLNLFGGTDSNAKGPLGKNYFYKDFDDAYNTLLLANESRIASNGTLGRYGVSAGIDDKGRYISFIDNFDHVFIPGKGIPIYDRIYEDEIKSLYNPNLSALNEGDWITRSPELKKISKHKLNKGGILKAQNGTGLAGIPILGNLAKKAAYKIVTNPDVAYAGGATPKTIVKSLFSKNQEDDNKKFFLYGVERPYRDLGEAYNWQNDIDKNGYKNVKSYEGILNPYGEYLIDSKNKHLIEDNLGKDLLININSEYTDPNTGFIPDSIPYFDDVHGYRLKFHKDENGNIVASASDLYDFGKNYADGFSNIFEERSGNKNGKRILEIERNALNAVGQPYILTNKYSVRFVDNPEGEELMRVRNLEGEILSNKKSGGVLSAQKGTPGFVNPFTNQLAKFIVDSIPENPNPVKVIKRNQPVKVIKENQPVKVISTGNPVKVIKVNQPVTLIKETHRRDDRPKRLDDVSYKNHAKFVEHGGKTA